MNNEHFKNIRLIKSVAEKNNFVVFENNSKPFNLNIWAIRNNNRVAGAFDDTLLVFYKNAKGSWIFHDFKVTTDPSEISLLKRKVTRGVAIVRKGQYRNCWELGLHKGSYPALVQRGNLTVIRDFNKDNILDIPDENTLKNWEKISKYNKVEVVRTYSGIWREEYLTCDELKYRVETSYNFGINCHRASAWKILEKVGLYSEGCIVHQNPYKYRDVFMNLINSAAERWGNSFTLTLCHEEDFYK